MSRKRIWIAVGMAVVMSLTSLPGTFSLTGSSVKAEETESVVAEVDTEVLEVDAAVTTEETEAAAAEATETVIATAAGKADEAVTDTEAAENEEGESVSNTEVEAGETVIDAVTATAEAGETVTGTETTEADAETMDAEEETETEEIRFILEISEEETSGITDEDLASAVAVADGDVTFDSAAWLYNSSSDVYYQTGVVYCDDPYDTTYESFGIYVPAAYMNMTANGDGTYTFVSFTTATVGNYTAETAPIVIPVNTAGYSAQAAPTGFPRA